jgi:predicted extracellular nuclease
MVHRPLIQEAIVPIAGTDHAGLQDLCDAACWRPSVPLSTSISMPIHRSLTLLVAAALALGMIVPLVDPAPAGAVSDGIVISELRTRGPAGGNDEFIELHNRSTAPVSVGGWLVRGSNATGSVSTRATLAAGTVIGPGCFLLVTNSFGYSGTTPGDANYATGITDTGGVAIVEPASGTIVDQVGMNPGSMYREGTTLAPLTTDLDQGYERRPGGSAGHVDTDDNATDFALLAPSAPQSSASPCLTFEDPTPPTGAGTATPASVAPGDTSLLGVAVAPGANPTSTGVTVTGDLSAIGGSAAQAFDDGDADGTFSFLASVAAGTAPGALVLPVTIADAEGRSSTTGVALTVTAPPTEIWQIQGASHLSTMDGELVFGVEGVVTARSNSGFWMTDPTSDADPATSDGIFVFRGVANVGDHVTVDGRVDEFRSGGSGGFENLTTTEILSPTVTVLTSGNPLPTTVIGVDRLPPTLVIDDDSTTSVEAAGAVFDPAADGIDFWESLEGMRLAVADAVAVGPTNGFGEVAVISALQADAGVRTPRGGILVRKLGAAGDYQPGDFNPERLILDDVLANTPDLNSGDAFATDPVGVLDYSFGNFKLLVTADPGRVDNGLAREVAAPAAKQELSVATFNVENLSALDSDAKVNALAAQIVDNLRAPDIIAIEEMQDNSGPANDGVVAANLSWQRLIDAIVAAGGPRYDYRQIDPQDNADGGVPGGNIRVGFLFNGSGTLTFVDRPGGDATTDTDVVRHGNGAALTVSPGRVLDASIGGAAAFELTRKSLVGEFRYRGETIFVVANHFSSKGDDRPLFGHFQPPFRLTEFESADTAGVEDGWRHAQAQAVNDFVDEILAVDPGAHVIVLGDINDFDFSETVDIIAGVRVALDPGPFSPDADGSGQTATTGQAPIMMSLFDRLPERERYSYVFDGNSQVLDQVLVSRSLWNLGTSYDVVHVNAEFFAQASDHDPSVMRVAFTGNGWWGGDEQSRHRPAPSRGRCR